MFWFFLYSQFKKNVPQIGQKLVKSVYYRVDRLSLWIFHFLDGCFDNV